MATTPLLEEFASHTVEADGRRIRYVEAGRGPLLLIVHGAPGMEQNVSTAHTALAADYRVVALELPGWGETDGGGIESVRDLAAVVVAFAHTLGHETFDLIGTSVGGAVALWSAIDHPGAVGKVVLEAPAAFRNGVPKGGPGPGGPGLSGPRPGSGGPGPGGTGGPDGSGGPPGRPSPKEMARMDRLLGPERDPELLARMPECQVPALILLGAQDPMFSSRFAADYKRLAVSSVAIVYGAGHDIKGDRPEAFLSIVSDFLRRGPAFVVSERSTLLHA